VLKEDRQWIEGSDEFVSEYQGIVYHLQSEDEKRTFDSDPERYAPQLLECDPVEMYFTDKAVHGSTEYGAYFDGKLYLFVSHDNRETFKKSPLKFTETRHVFELNDVIVRR
jgi:YHS domain-containing protein